MDMRCKNCRYADWDKEDGYIAPTMKANTSWIL